MPLTDTQIAKLPWKPKPYVLTDRAGLQLYIYPRGVKTWRARFATQAQPGGRLTSHFPKLGRWPEMGVAGARTAASAFRKALKNGDPVQTQVSSVTLKTFLARYLREVLSKKRKDLTEVETLIKRDILPSLGFRPVASITADQVQKLIFGKRDGGAPSTAEKMRSLLDRVFKYAMVCGLAEKNPVDRTQKAFVYTRRSRTRALSEAELRIFLQKIRDVRLGWKYGVMLELLLLTLARKSELLLAQWKNINFEAATWEVPEENSKTSVPHIVYLSGRALELLHSLAATGESWKIKPAPDMFVFPAQGSTLQPSCPVALNRAMRRIKWGMPHFVPHDLRRTASTRLNEMRYDADVIEKAMNHAVRNQVRGVYNRAQYADERRKMLQEWADWLEKLKDE
jgi:integrase